jgi:hypothetical protein
VQLALRAPLLGLASLPSVVAWDNMAAQPVTGAEYLEEQFIPATSTLLSMPASGGSMEDTGLYVLRWFAKPGDGLNTLPVRAAAVLALYPPGTGFLVSTGVVVRVRSDVAPTSGGLQTDRPGWSVVTITIPWRLSYNNT